MSGRRLENGKEITSTGLATLRRDGFASMSGSGELTTETLKFKGEYFFVNAAVRGDMKVEILDANGKSIAGFTKDDCLSMTGDGTKLQVTWKNNTTLKSLSGQNIKVKFYLTDADLYAFWISDYATGESRGYTAGGGPGLNALGTDTK